MKSIQSRSCNSSNGALTGEEFRLRSKKIMLAHRIIPTILTSSLKLVKGQAFASDRVCGHALQSSRIHSARGVDELVLLDVSATPENREPDYAMVEALSEKCFIPLGVGGGIRTMKHIKSLLNAGADKVIIGTAAIEDPHFIRRATDHYGSQAITIAVDVKKGRVFSNCGKVSTTLDPTDWACTCVAMGAGEILLTSIDRDGTMTGYDLPLIQSVSQAVSVPVIASGGAGTYEHLYQAIHAGASAVAAGAMWLFSDQTPAEAAKYLMNHKIEARV